MTKTITITTHPIPSQTLTFTDTELQLEHELSQEPVDMEALKNYINQYKLKGATTVDTISIT